MNWCPGLGHGAGQRGGHRRRSLRARQLPRVPAPVEAVDDAHHRVRRPADRRSRPARLARLHQADAAQLDRTQHRRADRLPGCRDGPTSRCSRPDPTPCSAPPTWCSRRSTPWSTSSPPTSGRQGTARAGQAARPHRRGRARLPAGGQPSVDIERQAEAKDKTGVFVGVVRHQPRQRRARSRSSWPTTCSWATARERSWPCPGRISVTGTSPIDSVCRSIRTVEPPAELRRRGLPRRRPAPSTAASSMGWTSPTANEPHHRLAASRGATATRTVQYKLRDWLFSRQRYWGEPFPIVYGDDDLPPRRSRTTLLPVVLPELDDFARAHPTARTPSPSRRSAGPPTGPRSRSTSAMVRRTTGAS